MNKYEEALDWLKKTFNQYLGDWQLSSVHFGIHRDFKELVDKEIELQSRKEKLIVGSEWVCVVQCVVMYPKKKMTEAILTTVGGVCEVYKFGDDDFVTVIFDGSYFVIPPNQFLLCFKPKEVR